MARCWTCERTWRSFRYTCPECAEARAYIKGGGPFSDLSLAERRRVLAKLEYTIAVLEWGFDSAGWLIERQTQLMERTLEFKARELLEQGDKALFVGDIGIAVDRYERAFEEDPTIFDVQIGLALAYLAGGRTPDAEKMLSEHAVRWGNFQIGDMDYRSYAYRLLGHIAFCEDHTQEAVDFARRAIECSPKYADALYDFAHYSVVLEAPEQVVPRKQISAASQTKALEHRGAVDRLLEDFLESRVRGLGIDKDQPRSEPAEPPQLLPAPSSPPRFNRPEKDWEKALRSAMFLDLDYRELASLEPDFDVVRDDVQTIIEDLEGTLRKRVEEARQETKDKLHEAVDALTVFVEAFHGFERHVAPSYDLPFRELNEELEGLKQRYRETSSVSLQPSRPKEMEAALAATLTLLEETTDFTERVASKHLRAYETFEDDSGAGLGWYFLWYLGGFYGFALLFNTIGRDSLGGWGTFWAILLMFAGGPVIGWIVHRSTFPTIAAQKHPHGRRPARPLKRERTPSPSERFVRDEIRIRQPEGSDEWARIEIEKVPKRRRVWPWALAAIALLSLFDSVGAGALGWLIVLLAGAAFWYTRHRSR